MTVRRWLLAGCALVPMLGSTPTRAQNKVGSVAHSEANSPGGYASLGADGTISTQPVLPTGSLTTSLLGDALTDYGILADRFKQTADGTDDAPAIQRAVNNVCSGASRSNRVMLLSRHYAIQSSISWACSLWLVGQGFNAQSYDYSGAASALQGTYFDLSATFSGSNTASFNVVGESAQGGGIKRIAFTQPQPSVVSGQAWTPAPYPYVISLSNIGGEFTLDDLFFRGVTNGVMANNSARLHAKKIVGQFFNSGLYMDNDHDVAHLGPFHMWVYYSQAPEIVAYQQAHAAGVILGGVDTPMLDKSFFFGMLAGVEFITGSGSTPGNKFTTKFNAPLIQCDSIVHCLLVEAQGVTGSVGILNTSGQQGTGSGVAIANADALHIDGSAVFQIAQLWEDYVDTAPVVITSSSACSNIAIGQMYVDFSQSSQSSVNYLNSRPCTSGAAVHQLTLSAPPIPVLKSSGQTLTPNAGGGGNLYWAVPTTH